MADKLQDDTEAEVVIRNLETLRSHLTQPGNSTIHVSADASRLADLYPKPSTILSQIVPDNHLSNSTRWVSQQPDW